MCMPIARVRVLGFGPGHLTFICEHYRWHPQRQQLFARVHLLNLYIRFGVRCCQTETMLGRSGAQRAYANCCFACCYTATPWGRRERLCPEVGRTPHTHQPLHRLFARVACVAAKEQPPRAPFFPTRLVFPSGGRAAGPKCCGINTRTKIEFPRARYI